MKITIFGLAITSSWGNGHATTFRALARALHQRGHSIVFFEKNLEWYASNRDIPQPPFCEVHIYDDWKQILPVVRQELRDSDVAVVGSYFPDGITAINQVFDSAVRVRAFYDIDTPITISQLREAGETSYLLAEQIPGFDRYFSFTGGPALTELEQRFGARRAVPLYCSVDPDKHHPFPPEPRFACELSYMGTYAPDRQSKIDELLCKTAAAMPSERFIVAGPQYPGDLKWPANIERIVHLEPKFHPRLYSSSRLTLNVTRRDMVMAGYSPSVRLFEAAACGAAIISDNWPGLDTFFVPGKEILLPSDSADVLRYLRDTDPELLRRMGSAARERIVLEHSSSRRAEQFEQSVSSVASRQLSTTSV